MKRRIIIGVMGAGKRASKTDVEAAFLLGKLIAERGWIVLSGGRNAGVMDAVSRGAKAGGGLTVGILPGGDARDASPAIDIPIITGMGSARNNINVLSSDVVIACGTGGAGTFSEIALAIKAQKPVVLLNHTAASCQLFKSIDGALVHTADSPEKAVQIAESIVTL
jgi:uncharacterized protein (TIGR00725 family)